MRKAESSVRALFLSSERALSRVMVARNMRAFACSAGFAARVPLHVGDVESRLLQLQLRARALTHLPLGELCGRMALRPKGFGIQYYYLSYYHCYHHHY